VREIKREIKRLRRKPVFLESDKLDVAFKNGRLVLTTCRRGRGRRSSRYSTISIPSR
jgi:hypothetical protein